MVSIQQEQGLLHLCVGAHYESLLPAKSHWRKLMWLLWGTSDDFKNKKIYWIELKKCLFPPNLFSIKVNMSKNTEKEVKNDLMSSNVISITVDQNTDPSNITRLAWLLIMIKQILNTFIRVVPINISARYYHMMWHLIQITGTHGFWWRKKIGFKENFSVMMDGAKTMLGTNVGFTQLIWIETGHHILCVKESARQRHEIECCDEYHKYIYSTSSIKHTGRLKVFQEKWIQIWWPVAMFWNLLDK